MTNQDEDLLLSHDEDPPTSARWSPSSLLTPEATSITAFSIALISATGFGNWGLVAASVFPQPTGPGDLRSEILGALSRSLWRSARSCSQAEFSGRPRRGALSGPGTWPVRPSPSRQ